MKSDSKLTLKFMQMLHDESDDKKREMNKALSFDLKSFIDFEEITCDTNF
jgi:hypothetical protein